MRQHAPWILLVLTGSFAGGIAATSLFQPGESARAAAPLPTTAEQVRKPLDTDRFEDVVRKVSSAVVSVDAVKPQAAQTAKGKAAEESGSGVIVHVEGISNPIVVTNNHVVGGARPTEITITLADGRILRPEKVWTDPESDIAILKPSIDELPAVELGDSSRTHVGQWVLAFGSPFGLNQTVTHGIISARDRGQISLGATIRIKEFLQTDAAINPGSSGGPLVDMNGQVIGINTAIASNNGNNSGVSFSIPSNLVKRVARELIEKGVVSRGYLGLQLAPSLEPASALKLGLTRAWGAMVETVHPDGPAAVGGIRTGDVILKLDSIDIRDENHLINIISSLPVNQRVRVSLWRNRQSTEVEVTVGEWTTAMSRTK